MIDVSCPKCKTSFQVGDEFLGLTVQCGSCSGDFTVSAAGATAPADPQMMDIVCPGCQTRHQIPVEARGAEAECMICQILFRIPDSGSQGVAVESPGAAPAPAASPFPSPAPAASPFPSPAPAASPFPSPAPAASPFPSPMAAAAPKPSFPGQANASGIVPGTPGGIDYKNTSTIRLTRSSLFSGGTAGKPPTPFGSGLIPALPPSGSAAPKPTAPASRPPVPTPVPPATPAPVTPPPPAPAPATPAGKRGGAAARPETGKIPAMKQAGKGASPLLLGKAMAAGVPMESGETLVAVKELSGNSELPWMNLMLALAPVLMIPVFVVLAPSIGTGLSAGIGTIVGLACWLGIIYRHMTAPHGKICMVVTDKRSVLAAPDSKQETRF